MRRTAGIDALVDELGGERAFVAVLVLDAAEAARSGDQAARQWLERCAPRWLALALDGLGEAAHQRLLAALPEPELGEGEASAPWQQLALW